MHVVSTLDRSGSSSAIPSPLTHGRRVDIHQLAVLTLDRAPLSPVVPRWLPLPCLMGRDLSVVVRRPLVTPGLHGQHVHILDHAEHNGLCGLAQRARSQGDVPDQGIGEGMEQPVVEAILTLRSQRLAGEEAVVNREESGELMHMPGRWLLDQATARQTQVLPCDPRGRAHILGGIGDASRRGAGLDE